jgi:hypothetical protein
MKDLILRYAAILIVVLVVTLIFLACQLPDVGPQRFVNNNPLLHVLPVATTKEHLNDSTNNNDNDQKKKKKNRLAVLLPFIGTHKSDIPPYLDLFCFGASGSAAIADFIIVHNGVLADYHDDDNDDHKDTDYAGRRRRNNGPCHVASNVVFINLHNTTNMARLLLQVVDDKTMDMQTEDEEHADLAIPYDHLLQLLTMHLERYPYILVEFKPALGYILHDYLLLADAQSYETDQQTATEEPRPQYKYTHWAYSDLDILWGDLNRHLEHDEWNNYHVVTFSFGDQQRLYARGQFTMHKLPKVPPLPRRRHRHPQQQPAAASSNFMIDLDKDDSSLLTLWKYCPYLTQLDVRFANIVQQWKERHQPGSSKQQQHDIDEKPLFQLESAEGCYSVALLHNEDISVKFAVKAWTDEHHAQELPQQTNEHRNTQKAMTDTIPTHGLYVSRGHRRHHGVWGNEKDDEDSTVVVVLSKPTSPASAATTKMTATSTMTTWWQDDPVYSGDGSNLALQQTIGAMEPLTLPTIDTTSKHKSSSNNDKKNKNCMYWVQEQYQPFLCLQQDANEQVTATDNVFWIKGQLYKQSFQNRPLKNGTMLTAPFFHFQEWKRSFRFNQLAPVSSSLTASTTPRQETTSNMMMQLSLTDFVLGPEGVMPLHFHHPSTTTTTLRKRLGGGGGGEASSSTVEIPSPLGIPAYDWKAGRRLSTATTTPASFSLKEQDDGDDRSQLPTNYYCLSFETTDRFAAKCRFITSWQDAEAVHIVSWAPAWQKMSVDAVNNDVTLALTWQIALSSKQLEQQNNDWQDVFESVVISNLLKWQGQPSVLVIALTSATGDTPDGASSSTTAEALAFLRERLSSGPENHDILDSALIAIVVVPPPPASEKDEDHDDLDRMTLSRKALLNMAVDCAPTRWHLAGLDMEQGFILSTHTVVFAQRTAETHGKLQHHHGGNIFWIPQFGLAANSTSTTTLAQGAEEPIAVTMRMTLPQLMVARQKEHIKPISFFDKSCTSFSSDSSSGSGLDNLWWIQTTALVDPTGEGQHESVGLGRRAALLQEEEQNILSLLTPEKFDLLLEEGLFALPFLLVDNVGPQRNMLTHLMARHVEELVGDHCFNPLQLAQLVALGYRLNVLEGAFALSTDAARKLSATTTSPKSRCSDGCLLFDSRHDDLLHSIIHEEITRPAKTGVLRAEMLAEISE